MENRSEHIENYFVTLMNSFYFSFLYFLFTFDFIKT